MVVVAMMVYTGHERVAPDYGEYGDAGGAPAGLS